MPLLLLGGGGTLSVDSCPGYADESGLAYTLWDSCSGFDGLYPGSPLTPPPLPPGVPPPPGWPPPPTYRFEVQTWDDCGGFDAAFASPEYEIEVIDGEPVSATESDCICCGCQCCSCNGYWSQFSFTISGVTGSARCQDMNGTHTITNVGGCLWSLGGPPPP